MAAHCGISQVGRRVSMTNMGTMVLRDQLENS